jgi:drug/metabolite transporter (DMT)-like permease
MADVVAPVWQRIYAIPGLLIFGTAAVVTQKFLVGQSGVGKSSLPPHPFSKPWFLTDVMFLVMGLSYICFLLVRHFQRDPPLRLLRPRVYLFTFVCTLCDVASTALLNIELLTLQASVWQMLRGASTIFSALFCAFVLRRPHYGFTWWSVVGVIIALAVVGGAAVFESGAGQAGVTQGQTILAILLTVLAQLVQATQLSIQDHIIHDLDTHPLDVTGLKGVWGFAIGSGICLPAVQFIRGKEGNGVHEDTIDTFDMIANSRTILILVLLYAVFILGYKIGGMVVVGVFSAVYRTIIEGIRTLCIWMVQLGIHYVSKNPKDGEQWTRWSFMKLAGFLLLLTSLLMYDKVIRLPCFRYPDDPNKDPRPANVDGLTDPLISARSHSR